MKYDVTIGMPIYKSRPYIERAMLSALDQTYPSIEFLLVDDAGDDGSIDVILQLKSQHPRGKDIRVISHDKNQGVSFSRNEIIENAQGTYLFFMDSDDEIRDNTIDLLMSQATKYEADFVIGSYEKIDLGESESNIGIQNCNCCKKINWLLMLIVNMVEYRLLHVTI